MSDTIGTAYVQIEPSFDGVVPEIEHQFGGAGEEAGNSFSSGFGSVMGGIGKAVAGATAAGAAAVGKLTQSAVSAYSDFEQLEGGAELLFGDAFDKVMNNAETAFTRVQMSANEYLEQANSYATGLKESLGGNADAAAELADKIMVAQADIVSATGANAESISNAFGGIMKNNFSMLDNLQLGIKPTKEGMQEVIDKMNEWNASQGNATDYQMDNLADMQSAIVDYVKYVGMAGYAHDEASSTIQGSLATAKASWENLLTAMGTGDTDALTNAIDNFVESAKTVGTNIMPVIEKALKGVAQLIQELGPQIAEMLPDLISEVLPGLLTAGVDIIKALGEGIIKAIPDLMPAITDVILQLCDMLIEMLPELIQVGMQVILQLAMGIAQALPELIPAIVDTILAIVDYFLDNIDLLVDASIAIIVGLAEGLITALPKLIEKAPEIIIKLVEALIRNIPKILEASVQLIVMFVKGIVDSFKKILEIGKQIIDKVKEGIFEKIEGAKEWGKDLIKNFVGGIKSKWEDLKNGVKGVAETVKNWLGFSEPKEGPLSNFHTFAPDMMELYAKGITDNVGVVKDALQSATVGMMDTSVNANVAQNVNAQVGAGAGTGSDVYRLLAEYLPIIASGEGTQVALVGDADTLFDMIKKKNNEYKKQYGVSAFA